MSRAQVGIERLPTRRMSNEPRELMNCRSCRKRKIKCNRLRPTCEACKVFHCQCVYDAVPKKRGPKSEVLEALLTRMDGLEKTLQDEKKPPLSAQTDVTAEEDPAQEFPLPEPLQIDTDSAQSEVAVVSPGSNSESSRSSVVQNDALLDTYFARCNGQPYYILEETGTRQRIFASTLPLFLLNAIYAIAARYTPHPDGYHAAATLSEDYAMISRACINFDDISIDSLQAILLLVITFTAAGKDKKSYILLASAVGMAVALNLHRECDSRTPITLVEKEIRRRLFWTCYTLDRFAACGSKRPSLISDGPIFLRLPSWSPNAGALPVEGEAFQNGTNLQYHSSTGKRCQGSSGMLVDVVRILGIANKYLAAGGVKGDSHFPWHSLSNFSKIRNDLDIWASGTQEVFISVEALFGQPDSTTLVLSKLIYHLIHCMIYRQFLPIDLTELSGSGHHQSWQIEATKICFMHANAIAELVELGKQASSIEWPAFVGYCICTAGTVHVHGTHYHLSSEQFEIFSASTGFLSREMHQLSELRYAWSSVQHQLDTLQTVYSCHAKLAKSLANDSVDYSSAFQCNEFFDRYADLGIVNGAYMNLCDMVVEGGGLYMPSRSLQEASSSQPPPVKRKRSSASLARAKYRDLKIQHQRTHFDILPPMLHTPYYQGVQDYGHISPSTGSGHCALGLGMIPPDTPQGLNSYSPPNLPISPSSSHGHKMIQPSLPDNYESMFNMTPALKTVHPPQTIPSTTSMHDHYYDHWNNSHITPGGESASAGTEEKDPHVNFVEHFAENENTIDGGNGEIDLFGELEGAAVSPQ